jgi:hypothetical protein
MPSSAEAKVEKIKDRARHIVKKRFIAIPPGRVMRTGQGWPGELKTTSQYTR